MTSRQRWTLIATIIGSGAVFLDGTLVNVALPRIGRELPADLVGVLEGQAYVVSGYLAVLAALLILAGALSDHYGRRRVYAIGLSSFGVASALCGLAPSFEWLILFRLLQGAAGALMVPGALSIITQTFAPDERGRAFGVWTAATSGLTLLGPLVGGLLVDTIGWRVAFLINVPVLAVALWITLRHIEESRNTEASRRFDWLGSLVAAAAVGGLSFGIIRGGAQAWQDPVAWGAMGLGVAALIAFPILMATRRDPLVPLSLFKSRAFTTINLATFFVYGGLYVTLSYQGILLQNVLGYTATAAGAVGLPVSICVVILSTRVGTMAGRIGARPFLTAGPLLMALGLLWFARLPADSDPWRAAPGDLASIVPPVDVVVDVLPTILLFGIGISLVIAPLTNALMGSIPGRYSGLGSAINNAVARVGQPLLGAVIFLAISGTFYSTLHGLAPEIDVTSSAVRGAFPALNGPRGAAAPELIAAATRASVEAFHQAMLVAAGLMAIGGTISWFGLHERAPARTDDAATVVDTPVGVA